MGSDACPTADLSGVAANSHGFFGQFPGAAGLARCRGRRWPQLRSRVHASARRAGHRFRVTRRHRLRPLPVQSRTELTASVLPITATPRSGASVAAFALAMTESRPHSGAAVAAVQTSPQTPCRAPLHPPIGGRESTRINLVPPVEDLSTARERPNAIAVSSTGPLAAAGLRRTAEPLAASRLA